MCAEYGKIRTRKTPYFDTFHAVCTYRDNSNFVNHILRKIGKWKLPFSITTQKVFKHGVFSILYFSVSKTEVSEELPGVALKERYSKSL